MRITFILSGGFVGSIRGCRLDTATLPAVDRGDVEHLVEASGLTESFERFSPTGRGRPCTGCFSTPPDAAAWGR